MNNAELKTFIKETLGCGCPDKVFEKIDVDPHRVTGYSSEFSRIVVGDTLLIYIVHPVENDRIEDGIDVIATAGRSDRNSHQYNRFRLVIATDENPVNTDPIAQHFMKTFASDEKMHIHFVSRELVESL